MEQNDATKINFAVTAANGNSRAADVFCNTNMPSEFKVYAVTNGNTYINGDVIKNTATSGTATWENQSGNRYWPDTPVDFYAQVNGDDYFKWNASSAPTFENFTVNDAVASQTDLLYAVKTGQTKATTGTQSPVTLNFHHALSQIVFYAKNVNPNIYVEVTGVSVCNVKNSGTYTLPTEDTDANIPHGTTTGTSSNGGKGTWDYGTNPTTGSYSVTFDAVSLKGDATNPEVKNLTDNTNTTSDFGHDGTADAPGTNVFNNAMILMPQADFAALVVNEGSGNLDEANLTGVYFKVKCTIWNVADTTAELPSATDVKLWDDKEIYIPVSGTWDEGLKYIYTLVFGDGNGGWDPHGPKPVLVPITFTVTVDEFIPVSGGNQDIPMKTE